MNNMPADPGAPGARARLAALLRTRPAVRGLGTALWRRVRRHRRGAAALAILGAGFATFGGLVATAADVPREERAERIWPVDVVLATRADHQPSVRFSGTVLPRRSLEIRPLVAGTVSRVSPSLRNGGLVRAGDVLLTVEPTDYALLSMEASAALTEARTRLSELEARVDSDRQAIELARKQLGMRRRDLARSEELFQKGVVAAPRLEQAQLAFAEGEQGVATQASSYSIQQARIGQQLAAIRRLEAQAERARVALRRTTLVAPFDAFVGKVNAEVGMQVSPSDRIAVLVGADELEVQITVPTEFYGRLVQAGEGIIGRPASIAWPMAGRDVLYPAQIDRTAESIDTASGGIGLYLRAAGGFLDQPLRPGAFVDVLLANRTLRSVVALPEAALHGENTVYVVAGNDRLAARRVDIVSRGGGFVHIGQGLNSGDKVVTSRFQEIGPGIKVAPRAARASTRG
jgi:RND family efflux transporter MFP subunit